MATKPPRSLDDLDDSTRLAVERTTLAHERTLMAWVRTATSLISFGFTIYKFFQYVRESTPSAPRLRLLDARHYALLMISMGLLSLAIATFQHHRDRKSLAQRYGTIPYSLATPLAAMVAGLGVLALVAVVFRQ